jgi:hypothetical protein
MGDEGDSGKLVKVAGAGFELELGAGLPKALAGLFPGWALKRHAKLAFSGHIIEKVRDGQALDDAEALYATEVLGEAEAKFIRRREIRARALAAYQSPEASQLPAAAQDSASDAAQGSTKTTASDWVNKIWDDADLVDDDMLQELYGRLLASEARSPGACSLLTLRALRYMDRDTAEDFAKLASLTFNHDWVPAEFDLLASFGASTSVLLKLADAGLITAPSSNLVRRIEAPPAYYRCAASILGISGVPKGSSFRIMPLTTAGRELCRIAQVTPQAGYVLRVAAWLHSVCPGIEMSLAPVPNGGWDGRAESLRWQSISR